MSTVSPENKWESVPSSFFWTDCAILIFITFDCYPVISVRYLFLLQVAKVMGKASWCGGVGQFGATWKICSWIEVDSPNFLSASGSVRRVNFSKHGKMSCVLQFCEQTHTVRANASWVWQVPNVDHPRTCLLDHIYCRCVVVLQTELPCSLFRRGANWKGCGLD